ncbi:MAG: cytochrome oxidase small assembly protein [Massilia sp.]
MTEPRKPNNARTAWLLAAVALFFFVMVFVKRVWLS